jgi:hypothetical protein
MSFFKGKQGKDMIIIAMVALIGYKFMSFMKNGGATPIKKQTI